LLHRLHIVKKNNILDYDRNTTYLDPHIGYNGYATLEERVTSAEDSIRVNWFDYTRAKNGDLKQITAALSSQVTDFLNLGFGVNIISGESDDFYSLNKVGYFDLMESANSFQFAYDTLNTSIKGTSKYSGMNISFGATVKLNRINIGLRINTPYTLEKEWEYSSEIAGIDTSGLTNLRGTDKLDLPMTYAVGISFNPIDEFRIAFDLEKANYSKAEFNLANPDSNLSSWADQTIIRVGAEYNVYDFITLLAGYRNKTEIFIPDGAAIKDQGPNAKAYTFGLSLDFDIARLDLAYELRNMTYFDSYFSNTNYNTQTYSNLLLGCTVSL
jgi:opacity protein-like surface antigen